MKKHRDFNSHIWLLQKLLRIMKLTCILILVFVLGTRAASFAQAGKLNLNLKNGTLVEALKQIEDQSEYYFYYNNDEVRNVNGISIKADNSKIEDILNELLSGTGLTYKVMDRFIVVKKGENPVNAQHGQQSRTISGRVTDSSGAALPGVTVVIKNTTNGTITDANGNYSLVKVPADATLVFSFVGMKTQEIVVAGNQQINVELSEETVGIEEVVAVGFGVQKKVNLTGAVATASAEDLESRPVTSATQALQGMIPGLNITTSGVGGELNANKSINVRGTATVGGFSSGSPYVLIDGMEGDINNINPQDIDNISVLKDAAASAIYGSRAPFGVILITTKSGREGKTVINYNNSFRYSTPILLPKMQNSWQFVNYYDDAYFNVSNTHWATEEFKQKVYNYFIHDGIDEDGNPIPVAEVGSGDKWNYDWTFGNVDWIREYYKKWSPSQEHNLSVSGGTGKSTYYISTNYLTQDGFFRYGTDELDRYTMTGKISSNLASFLKVDFSSRFTRKDYSRPTNMNGSFYDGVLRRARPIRPKYDPNGYLMSDINYIAAMTEGGRQKEQNDDFSHQLRLTITPLKDWNIIGEFNFRSMNNWTHWYQKQVYSHYATDYGATYRAANTSPTQDQVYENSYKATYLNPNVYTNYTKQFGKHHLGITSGMQVEQWKQRSLTAQRADMITADLPVIDLTTSTQSYGMNGNYDLWKTVGFFGRINYDFDERYLLELNLRYDGSSRFRRDERWVETPSVSLGWNVAREEFWSNLVNHVQNLKLRISYGELANQNTNNWYPTYQSMGTGTANGQWIVSGARPNTATVPGLVSASLTWETVKTKNVGLDFGMLNNRLTGSFDYYVRETLNMVNTGIDLPIILGTSVPQSNNTDLKTNGWELQVGWRDHVGDFSYGVNLSISDSRTKITRYENPTNDLGRYREGEFLNNIYGYTTIGIAKTDQEMQEHLNSLPNGGQDALGSNWAAGDIMYADINEDGKVNSGANTTNDPGDLKVIGNSTPRFLTGLQMDAMWKGFDLQLFWQGILKRDWHAEPNSSMVFWGVTAGGEYWSTALAEHFDYFRPSADHPFGQNLDSYYPRPLMGNNRNQQIQTRYLQDASYIRLKNVQLGYTFNKELLPKTFISNLRLFISCENLFTITQMSKTMDPESAGIGQQGGTVYPLPKTYAFGLSVNF